MTDEYVAESRAWWKEATVYQIYPRSFADSDGDGEGDLRGIVERADYLADLGVDAVWLNPVYESPMADNGYDVSDYRAIDPRFGTMADWEALRDALHERDIRLIMDFVPNHTSDEHDWFRASRRRADGKEDWYHWRDGVPADEADWETEEGPADEAAPNNWRSLFGGPAWAYDDEREQWYLHLFHEKQPDLNWENPAVREAVADDMAFWLEKGIDGFRIDVINLLSKPEGLPSGDPEAPFNGTLALVPNGPRIHEYVSELADRLFAGRELLTVGETIGEPDIEEARKYVGEDGDGLGMTIHFEHVGLDRGERLWDREPWALTDLKGVFDRWQEGLYGSGWNCLYFGNHDQARAVSRFGDDGEHRRESAKLLCTFLHTLRGTPYVYMGEELGTSNPTFESLSEFRDIETRNAVEGALASGEVDSFEAIREGVNANSRDTSRTPMQWSAEPNAGFTDPDAEPWIRPHEDYETVNVAVQRDDPDSVWHHFRDTIRMRGEHDVLVYGRYENHTPDHERLWVYTRTLETDEGTERALVALNWSGEHVRFEPPADTADADARLLSCTYPDPEPTADAVVEPAEFRPWEGRVYLLE